jgi:hypothetical protein
VVKSVGEVAIIIGADLGPMNRALGQAEGRLKSFERSGMSMGSILGTAMGKVVIGAGAAAVGLAALTRASMDNIDAVSKQARVIGLSVASFQAMSMVAGEAGVETEALSKMLIKLQDNIVQASKGTKAQVEAFQKLGISIAELGGMSVDEQFKLVAESLSGIEDPATRTATALDVFGKAGAAALNMVDGYAAAVDNAAKFQRELGIAVSDLDAQRIEAANDSIGRMWMAFEGLGNIIAVGLAPALEATSGMLVQIAADIMGIQTATVELQNYMAVMEEFGSTSTAAAMVGSWTEFTELMQRGDALLVLQELAEGYESVASGSNRATLAMQADINALSEEFPILADAIFNMADNVEDLQTQLRQALSDGNVQRAAELRVELGVAVDNLAKALSGADALSTLDLSGSVAWANSLATAFGTVAAKVAAAVNAASMMPGGMTTGTGLSSSDNVATLMPPGSGAVTTSPRPGERPIDWIGGDIDDTGGGGGGGGGGLAEKFAARLETIVTSLQTEREVIEAWYAEAHELIQQATDAELEALGGKHEALERLEEEHQRRLLGIKDMGNQWSVESVLKGGAEILTAMGAINKKAMKAAGIVSAAQALISTYEGAAAELKKGTFGFASAAAVIAKGLGFVAAIKSAASGGEGGGRGGGGSRAGGSAAPAASAPPVQRLLIDYNGPAAAMGSFRALVDMMNQAGKAGYVLNAQITGRS